MAAVHALILLKRELIERLASVPPGLWAQKVAEFSSSARALMPPGNEAAALALVTELREDLNAAAAWAPGLGKQSSRGILPLPGFPCKLPPTQQLEWLSQELVNALVLVGRPQDGDNLVGPVQRVIAYIDEHYREPLTLKSLSDLAGWHKGYLAQMFRRVTGHTVHQYLTKVRIRNAVLMIKAGEKIEATSLLVGYRSKKNFYKQFKRCIGSNPGNVRREKSQSPNPAPWTCWTSAS